ncbi:uncharacterized protein LOC121833200 [Ixodes scapularis]|uniref:uncharacterized protein LOC121833200 n=1 Tax=Ixodes scapularis TaxID=6945 RepID=UPI001C3835EE|nr:uncharacterized protein LOC121833200 [Ixodes scapularis]
MAEKESPYDEFSGLKFIEELLRDGDEDPGHSWPSSRGSPGGAGNAKNGVSDGATMCRVLSQGCSCGDPRDCSLTDILQEDGSQISVATGGKFPCLHIAISGLLEDRRYLLALDFCEMFTDRDQRFLTFTEPYYMPRPNHLEGRDWMKRVLYFNLTSIVNGGLQESGMTLTSNCEYLPTLRIMGSGHGAALSSSPVVRFALKKSELLAVSLKSAVPNSMRASARQFLLVRRYVMKR